MKKQQWIDYLTEKGAPFDPRRSAVELKRLVAAYVQENVKMLVDIIAEENGHKVLWTPPYHSDLQPIKLLWALVKGNVGRQYSNETTLKIVHQRLKAEFARVLGEGNDVVDGMIRKCAKLSKQFFDSIPLDDAAEDYDDNGGGHEDKDSDGDIEERDPLADDDGGEGAIQDDLGADVAVNLDDSGAFAMI